MMRPVLPRVKIDLSGIWRFKKDPKEEGINKKWFLKPLQGEPIWVPIPWNVTCQNLYNYEGTLWYEKEFDMEVDGGNRGYWELIFEGVNYRTEVWLNGHYLGKHLGGFTPFRFRCDTFIKNKNRIVVMVDNHRLAERIPHIDFPWFNYGGIYRNVWLERSSKVRLEELKVDTVRKRDWRLAVKAGIGNYTGRSTRAKLAMSLYDGEKKIFSRVAQFGMPDGLKTVMLTTPVKMIKPWNPDTPHLYTLDVCIYEKDNLLDKVQERIGFREIKAEGPWLVLNGRRIRLRGIGRIEDHPISGRRVPGETAFYDLLRIKELNANALRIAHAPTSHEVFDIADELGLFVILDLVPLVHTGYAQYGGAKHFENKKLLDDLKGQLAEAVRAFWNHPSIMIYITGCEFAEGKKKVNRKTVDDADAILSKSDVSSSVIRKFLRMMIKMVKDLDRTRLVAYTGASRTLEFEDWTSDMGDVILMHIYSGWFSNYGATPEETGKLLDYNKAQFDKMNLKKPVIVSEFGGMSLAGYRSCYKDKWSEEYHAHCMTEQIKAFNKRKWIKGGYLAWELTDIKSLPERYPFMPKGYNNSGIMDELRRPKLPYHTLRKIYEKMKREEESVKQRKEGS